MRADCKVAAALSLSLLAGACGKPDESVANSTSPTTSSALETAPQSYKRMRFVSDVEQARGTEVAAKPKSGHDMQHMAATPKPAAEMTNDAATTAVATMAASAPTPVLATEQSLPDQGVAIAARPAPEPEGVHSGPSADADVLDHAGNSGRSIGEAVLAGVMGGAVIRGGPASVRKCDPRSDGYGGRARPDLMMPSPVRQVFGGTRR